MQPKLIVFWYNARKFSGLVWSWAASIWIAV